MRILLSHYLCLIVCTNVYPVTKEQTQMIAKCRRALAVCCDTFHDGVIGGTLRERIVYNSVLNGLFNKICARKQLFYSIPY